MTAMRPFKRPEFVPGVSECEQRSEIVFDEITATAIACLRLAGNDPEIDRAGTVIIERWVRIAEANKCLQAAFNCWLDHKKILYPQLKRCKHLMLQLFEAITSVYQPHEVNTCHSQESRNLWVFDKAEAELDGMLGLKGKEIHYA